MQQAQNDKYTAKTCHIQIFAVMCLAHIAALYPFSDDSFQDSSGAALHSESSKQHFDRAEAHIIVRKRW